ncbi:MAG: polysaccharide biosynthesis/export family protein [Bacteroidetes bacterium]|nr:polysaccharide biosynthesis/export family protein [Bacteroidota bacterium]
MKKTALYIFAFYFALLLTGCSLINPSIMLKTPKDFTYTQFSDSLYASKEYKISANDIIEFRIYSNDGFKLIDLTSNSSSSSTYVGSNLNSWFYTIDYDGFTKLPVLGKTKLAGLTIREAELFLEEKYSNYYVKPFVIIKINNRRVIIYPGDAGNARVIPLLNNNTKLIEAIAYAGGLTDGGKAWKIKLIRGDLQKPEVYLIDLSMIDGIRQADMVLQANDIIYVEPRKYVLRKISTEVTPIVSLLTTIVFFTAFYFTTLKNNQ